MKRSIKYMLSLGTLMAIAFGSSVTCRAQQVNVERGQKVSDRIAILKTKNLRLRAALAAFEKNGHAPLIDEAVSLSGKINTVKKRHHGQTTMSDGTVEITFIPVVELPDEWQGTTITNFYDSGVLVQQYVADVVLTDNPYNPIDWTCNFETKYENNGVGYLMHFPGQYTGFALGTPSEYQSPPLDLGVWQFQTETQRTQFYQLYPEQLSYDPPGTDPTRSGGFLPLAGPIYHHARLPQVRSPYQVQQLSQWMTNPLSGWGVVGWGNMAREVGKNGTVLGLTCSVGAALSRGSAGTSCLAVGMTGIVAHAAINNLQIRSPYKLSP